ncbi:2'-5' RNA ligase family protein [Reichenbachiella sp.]|uniref:2'-5' RNA ligase family protein n=1 Tax=Reichenbachiella sp. TaxID=2184521 RepID=UPI003BAF1AB3
MGRLLEYLILFSPSIGVRLDVAEFKRQFERRYGYFESSHSIGHITVGNILIPSGKEGWFFVHLAAQLREIECFEFKIKGFEKFRSSCTIYACFEEIGNFKMVSEALRRTSQIHYLKKLREITFTPHLTIAKQLKPQVLERAYYPEYCIKEYEKTFDAYELIVLRRAYQWQKYELFRKLPLMDANFYC